MCWSVSSSQRMVKPKMFEDYGIGYVDMAVPNCNTEYARGFLFVLCQRRQNPAMADHIFDRVALENGIEQRLTKPC